MDILLLIAGIVLLFKKEVRISKRKTLSGRAVKILAALYILPLTVSFVGGLLVPTGVLGLNTVAVVAEGCVGIAVLRKWEMGTVTIDF